MSSSIGLQIPWDEIVDSPGKPILSSIIDNVAKYDATRVSKFDIPHLIFHSTQPGTGKTTTAISFASELDLPLHRYNASSKRTRGIEFVEEDIIPLVRSGMTRVILLDEADQLTNAAQMALKGVMEKGSCIFILTTNNKEKIDKAIQSRCSIFPFPPLDDAYAVGFLTQLAKRENLDVSLTSISKIVEAHDGDLRSMIISLTELHNCLNEKLKDSFLRSLSAKGFDSRLFIQHINDKSFTDSFKMLKKYGSFRNVLKQLLKEFVEEADPSIGFYEPTGEIINHIVTAYRDLQMSMPEEAVMAGFCKDMVLSAPLYPC